MKNKKMLARDRIRRILDPDTELWELGMTAGLGMEYGDVPTAGTVAGVGKVTEYIYIRKHLSRLSLSSFVYCLMCPILKCPTF